MTDSSRLLRYDTEFKIPTEVITDMQADKILPASVTAVLCRPCGAQNIKPRQGLFANMQRGELADRLSALLSDLKAYSRLLAKYRQAKNEFEKIYLHVKVLDELCRLHDALSSLAGYGELLSALSQHYTEQTELKADLFEISVILKSTQEFFLSSAEKMWVTPSSDIPTYKDQILICSLGLGLVIDTPDPPRAEAVSPSVAAALLELYHNEFLQIKMILARQDGIDLDEPCSYISELEFYIGVHTLIQKASSYDIPHTFPEISVCPCYEATELFDISLLAKNVAATPNDALFEESEKLFFVTGANGGGKTTYARAVGLNLLLFLSGCPIFARSANIYPFSALLTHFPADERFGNTGRLDDEYARAQSMLTAADEPFLIFNETFSGTDDKRGYSLMLELAEHITAHGYFGLYVTHFHDIEKTKYPILCAQIDRENDNKRTYRLTRLGDMNSSFAADILKKYRLDERSLRERLAEI